MWEYEKNKFKTASDAPATENCLEDMIASTEEGKKRKKEVMEVKAGKRRKKEVWGEAGSSNNGRKKESSCSKAARGERKAR